MSALDAISSQLPGDRLGQVYFSSLCQIITLRENWHKLHSDFGTHLEAASADPWPDRDQQFLGPAPELAPQRLEGLGNNVQDRTAPTGVDGGHGLISRVGDQNRQAIGGANRQLNARLVGDEGVALAGGPRLPCDEDLVGVKLTRRRQPFDTWPAGSEPRAEAVGEPGQLLQLGRPVHTVRVEAKQIQLYRGE